MRVPPYASPTHTCRQTLEDLLVFFFFLSFALYGVPMYSGAYPGSGVAVATPTGLGLGAGFTTVSIGPGRRRTASQGTRREGRRVAEVRADRQRRAHRSPTNRTPTTSPPSDRCQDPDPSFVFIPDHVVFSIFLQRFISKTGFVRFV